MFFFYTDCPATLFCAVSFNSNATETREKFNISTRMVRMISNEERGENQIESYSCNSSHSDPMQALCEDKFQEVHDVAHH